MFTGVCVSQEGCAVFVEDYSNNGTFVDGILIGKNRKLPLVNNAVLALSERRNKGEVGGAGGSTTCSRWAWPHSVCLCSLCLH